MITGERQAARIRNLYLKTILRQDVSFFDTETNTGEVVGRMSGDTVLIQDAMGEKVLILALLPLPQFLLFFSFSPFKFRTFQLSIRLQVGKFAQLVSTFVGGFVIAFIRGWLLTLVMLSAIPLLVISGGIMSMVLARMASRGQNAYASAANIVEQTIGSIRTVRSLLLF